MSYRQISFTVPCVPVAQPRQRHRVVQSGRRVFATNYTPTRDPVNAYKAAVQAAAAAAHQGPPLEGPLVVEMVFVLPRPKARPKWIKRWSMWWHVWESGGRVPHCLKLNDRDNLLKSTQDALNGILWDDDGQIWDGPPRKWVASGREQPHVEIAVRWEVNE